MLATLLDQPTRRQALGQRLCELRNDPLLAQPSEQKLNLGLTVRLLEELASLQKESRLGTQSEVIRTTLVAARQDPEMSKELRKLVVFTT